MKYIIENEEEFNLFVQKQVKLEYDKKQKGLFNTFCFV